ncbi:hypothetical protein GY12_00835 [Micrococcus luteus]|nr:hypothetical protein GY12_00835 [Micrococcus luteus]
MGPGLDGAELTSRSWRQLPRLVREFSTQPLMPGSLRSETAKDGAAETMATAGTDQARPVATARRLGPDAGVEAE